MTVTVTVAFRDAQPSDDQLSQTNIGGLRIEIDGVEVTEYTDQKAINKEVAADPELNPVRWYDYTGQPLDAGQWDFKGFYVEDALGGFIGTLRRMKKGGVERFEQVEVDLPDTSDVIVLSYLDGRHDVIRVAFQNRLETLGQPGVPTVDASVGYAVELDDLIREVARCGREYVEYAVGQHEEEWQSLRELRIKADELEDLVDS